MTRIITMAMLVLVAMMLFGCSGDSVGSADEVPEPVDGPIGSDVFGEKEEETEAPGFPEEAPG